MDPKAIIIGEWSILKTSQTVKALIAMETGAVLLFVDGVLAGTQPLTIDALKGWLAFQAAMVIAFFLRHAFAGLEAKIGTVLDPQLVQKIEAKIQDRAIKALQDRGHEAAASTLTKAFEADKKQGA